MPKWVPPIRGKGLDPTIERAFDLIFQQLIQLENRLDAGGIATAVNTSARLNGRGGMIGDTLSLPVAQDNQTLGPAQPFPVPLVIAPPLAASVSSINAASTIPGSAFSGGPITTSGTLTLALTSALLFRTALGAAPLVPTITANTVGPVALTAADSFQILTNTGAAASVTYNLPAASLGGFFFFVRDANFDVVVQMNGTDVGQIGASATSAGGSITLSSIGSAILIFAFPGGQYYGFDSGMTAFA